MKKRPITPPFYVGIRFYILTSIRITEPASPTFPNFPNFVCLV
jgi:hypothetical protein